MALSCFEEKREAQYRGMKPTFVAATGPGSEEEEEEDGDDDCW